MSGDQEFDSAERRLFSHYGVDYESLFVEIPSMGKRIRILTAGSGDPLLFVHGGLGVGAQYAPLMAELSGYRVLAPDRPGYGLSDAFSYRGCDLRHHAIGFIEGVLDGCGLERAAIVANSMGGLWALRFALERPSRVSALVQLGCPALLLGTSAPAPMRMLSVPGLNRLITKMPNGDHRQALKMLGERDAIPKLPTEYLETMEAAGRLPEFWPTSLSLLENVLRLRGARPGIGVNEDELRSLTMPVHFIWGTHDPFGPIATAERAAASVPDSRLSFVEAGHLPWLADPKHIAALLEEFLTAPTATDTNLQTPSEA